MCFGVPMRVVSVDGLNALCEGAGRREQVTLVLTGPVAPGGHVLVYLGSAIRELDAIEAGQITDAIAAVDAAVHGEAFEHLIADLIDREPELPAHLRGETSKREDPHVTGAIGGPSGRTGH